MPSREKGKPEIRDESTTAEWMHRLKTHPFLFVGTVLVLIIVIIAFVFLPMPGIRSQRGVPDLVFGYYNKVPIKYVRGSYFYQIQQSISRNQSLNSDDPNYAASQYRLWRMAFNEAVVHMGMLDEMNQAGYIAPEDVVNRAVAEMPEFQENGHFSVIRYRQLDRSSQMSYWRQAQDRVTVQNYVNDLSSLRSASKEAAFVASMAAPQRNFQFAIFPFSSYPDSEIAAYAKANPALFRVIHLSRITINSGEKEARHILDSVKNGTSTFEDAARTSSQDQYADKAGDMGIRMAYELASEIADEQAREKIVTLGKGDLSDLVKINERWVFFRAEEAVHPMDMNDKSQMGKVRNYVMTNARGQAEDWLIAEAGKFTAQVKEKTEKSPAKAKEEIFAETAKENNVAQKSFGPLPVNFGNAELFSPVPSSTVPELETAETNQFFWKAAFTTPLKTPSAPLVIGNSVIVLFPVEQTGSDENYAKIIEMYLPNYANRDLERVLRNNFLASKKLADHFNEMFWQTLGKNLLARPGAGK